MALLRYLDTWRSGRSLDRRRRADTGQEGARDRREQQDSQHCRANYSRRDIGIHRL